MAASPLADGLWSCQPAVREECDGLRLCGRCVALRRGALTGCQGESGGRHIDYRLRFHCWFEAGGPIVLLLHFQMEPSAGICGQLRATTLRGNGGLLSPERLCRCLKNDVRVMITVVIVAV